MGNRTFRVSREGNGMREVPGEPARSQPDAGVSESDKIQTPKEKNEMLKRVDKVKGAKTKEDAVWRLFKPTAEGSDQSENNKE